MPTRAAILRHLWHWKQALMGPVVGIPLLIYQQATGRSPSWGWFAFLVASGLAWQFHTEFQKIKAKTHSFEYPKLFLDYIQERNYSSDRSEFFVRVESEGNAFDVELTSEPVVGTSHKRITMEWEVSKVPVGKTPVPVRAFCKQYERGVWHLASGISSPGQIMTFFERKKDFPDELEITVKFKDFDGRKCPPKKFKISRYRDSRGNFQIGISPIENQAASRT